MISIIITITSYLSVDWSRTWKQEKFSLSLFFQSIFLSTLRGGERTSGGMALTMVMLRLITPNGRKRKRKEEMQREKKRTSVHYSITQIDTHAHRQGNSRRCSL